LKIKKELAFKLSYEPLKKEFSQYQESEISLKLVRDTVIKIRQHKLPDPEKTGNAGSFFKNPEIEKDQIHNLRDQFPDVPFHQSDEDKMKIPAAWLIEQCGWKGFRANNYGVHKEQPLVLVNYGNAHGKEIAEMARKIQEDVKIKFNIELTPEVNIL